MAINKEDTINVHHSPLRARPSARDYSGKRATSRDPKEEKKTLKTK